MDQGHSELGAKPKWCAHADCPCPHGEDPCASSIPPWSDPSLWQVTTTKTVEGLPVQPGCGVKQQYEALLRSHAIEYTKLMKEYEEMKASGNEKNEKFEAREKGWQKTIEAVLSLVKEMKGSADDSGQKEENSIEGGQKEASQFKGSGASVSVEQMFELKKKGVKTSKKPGSSPSLTAN